MRTTAGCASVIDKTATIVQEYVKKLRYSCFGSEFVAAMAKNDKLEKVDRVVGDQWNAVRIKLGLHDENHCFVRAAMVSTDKLLVAEETHFCDCRRDLKKHAQAESVLSTRSCSLTKSA